MLDAYLRPLIDPPLNRAGQLLARSGISATGITLAGFAFGLAACAALAFKLYGLALFLILLNRLADGLDGAVAREIDAAAPDSRKGVSDRGAYLDIVADFIVYSGCVFFFAVGRPETALVAAFTIFSFIGSGSSFLAWAIIAGRRGMETTNQGKKSFFYMAGLMEGTETIIFLVLICLLPDWFPVTGIIFGLLCWLTALGRSVKAVRDFR